MKYNNIDRFKALLHVIYQYRSNSRETIATKLAIAILDYIKHYSTYKITHTDNTFLINNDKNDKLYILDVASNSPSWYYFANKQSIGPLTNTSFIEILLKQDKYIKLEK